MLRAIKGANNTTHPSCLSKNTESRISDNCPMPVYRAKCKECVFLSSSEPLPLHSPEVFTKMLAKIF